MKHLEGNIATFTNNTHTRAALPPDFRMIGTLINTSTNLSNGNQRQLEGYYEREIHSRMNQILRAPLISDTKKYSKLPFKSSATPTLIPKRFKMPDLLKYDGATEPHENIAAYVINKTENDLLPHEIESVILKKFG
ncbi:hypothetical protein HAX54_041494 [Datura stramonium]|uniref:Uncharacterized protein n=1 Tax=Datura stramonium TaxID=4076 RepID=A0ABS8VT66_DATST|nr:hypothetical protein [Datura stramonium]